MFTILSKNVSRLQHFANIRMGIIHAHRNCVTIFKQIIRSSVHTRFKTNLQSSIAKLTKFQKVVYYSGIKIFNNLPHNIKDIANETKLFRNALKRFLLSNFL